MDEELKRRLVQMRDMSEKGVLGDAVKDAASVYKNFPAGMPVFIKLISDFYALKKTEEDQELTRIGDFFCQLIIVIYRDAKKKDEEVSSAIIHSFISDFPGVSGSCLYPQWESLAKAALAFKAASQNPLLAWQQCTRLVQAYNEFLNALLGFLIIGWRCALGKTFSSNVLNNTYGAKLNEFAQLTNGEDGAFSLFFRLAKPKLRNAIAHENIWLDQDTNMVRFTDGKQNRVAGEMGLPEFVLLAALGSHLAQAYIVAIASLLVMEEGTASEIAQIPPHLARIFRHSRS